MLLASSIEMQGCRNKRKEPVEINAGINKCCPQYLFVQGKKTFLVADGNPKFDPITDIGFLDVRAPLQPEVDLGYEDRTPRSKPDLNA
jgi:hypothetical protein